jgi:hypothetical protein
MNRDLLRRVTRLEGERHNDAPTSIFTDRAIEGEEGAALLANWRMLVDSGEAALSGCALVLIDQKIMTDQGWEAEHPHSRLPLVLPLRVLASSRYQVGRRIRSAGLPRPGAAGTGQSHADQGCGRHEAYRSKHRTSSCTTWRLRRSG